MNNGNIWKSLGNQSEKGGKFNVGEFNKVFEENIAKQTALDEEMDKTKLALLNKTVHEKPLYENNMYDIAVGIKNSWFGLTTDIMSNQYDTPIFTKQNRMFYIGITFILISIILFLYMYFSEDDLTPDHTIPDCITPDHTIPEHIPEHISEHMVTEKFYDGFVSGFTSGYNFVNVLTTK